MIIGIVLGLLLGSSTAQFALTPLGELRAISQPAQVSTGHGRRLGQTASADSFPLYTSTIDVPVDHFQNDTRYEPHSSATFKLRYHYDARYYKPGGPVIVLQSGEVQSVARIPYLQKGIINILAQATNGLGVILEHRYYGVSNPVPDFSTANMRFLTTEQAMADTAYFAKHVKFLGANITQNINPPQSPWIMYGGSYAGAFAAFMRVQYPDLFWGAIASSAVTNATWDYWHYYEPIREYGQPKQCIDDLQDIVDLVDQILTKSTYNVKLILKKLFGLDDIEHDDDFANTLTFGVGTWQQLNWDPAVSDDTFNQFCTNITSDDFAYPVNATRYSQLLGDVLKISGIPPISGALMKATLNFAGYIQQVAYSKATAAQQSIKAFYGNHDASFYDVSALPAAAWRAWPWQYCTEWGFLQTGSGVPYDRKPLISRLLTTNYTGMVCQNAFGLTNPANVSLVNKYGGPNISASRLAFVDGEWDPWRWASPHAPSAKDRQSTPQEPFLLIEQGVHHWDENGVLPTDPSKAPASVAQAQGALTAAVQLWLQAWKQNNATQPATSASEAIDDTTIPNQPTNGGNSPGSPATNWQDFNSIPANTTDGAPAPSSSSDRGNNEATITLYDLPHIDTIQAGALDKPTYEEITFNPQTSDKRDVLQNVRAPMLRRAKPTWVNRVRGGWKSRRSQSP